MATINISLTEHLREWVEAQIETGLYANGSDYIRDLIRKDQTNAHKLAAMQQAITDGIVSGDAGILDMQSIKRQARIKAGL